MKYVVKREIYERFSSGGLKTVRFSASSDLAAIERVFCLFNMINKQEWQEEERDEYIKANFKKAPTKKQLRVSLLGDINAVNGDGQDWITLFKNEDTGEVFIEEVEEAEEEDEEW